MAPPEATATPGGWRRHSADRRGSHVLIAGQVDQDIEVLDVHGVDRVFDCSVRMAHVRVEQDGAAHAPTRWIRSVGIQSSLSSPTASIRVAPSRPSASVAMTIRSRRDAISCVRVERFFGASVDLMKTMARASGHDHLSKFHRDDIATWHKEIADLTGIDHAGLDADRAR